MIEEVDLSFDMNGVKISSHLIPNKSLDKPVIILTGDSANGLNSKTWPPLISALIENDFTVITFDFLSQGDSEGERTELNLITGKRCLVGCLESAKNYGVDDSDMSYIASSFGGAVLIDSIECIPPPKAIVFKSPAIELEDAYLNDLGGSESIDEWRINSISKTLGLSIQAFDIASQTDLRSKSKQLKCQTLVVHGNMDEIVPVSSSLLLKSDLGDLCKIIIIEGGMHNYKQEGAAETFNNETICFLKGI